MRPKERIPLFMKLVNLDKLAERWKTLPDLLKTVIIKDEVEKYWLENYDQRIGQVLINLCLIPDGFNIWLDEETDILIGQGIEPREFLFWGSIYDKNMKRLEETKYRLIKDIETNHINNILSMFNSPQNKGKLNTLYRETFEKELEVREENPPNLGEIQ